MSNPSTIPKPERMECMEVFGSNRTTRRSMESAGLKSWLDCQELGGETGGDIHYISTCGSGDVFRTFLADVAGHGSEVAAVAQRVRNLMRRYINTFDQTDFARSLNDAMVADAEADRFATALLMTYYNPTHHLVICNAGHPRPLWFSTRNGGWRWLDEQTTDIGQPLRKSWGMYHLGSIANIPLGILQPTDYSQFAVQLARGDLVVLYTDGVPETPNADNELFGDARLFAAVERIGNPPANEFGPALIRELDQWRGTNTPQDDRTILVLEHTATRTPMLDPIRATKSMLKMLGLMEY